MARARNAVTWTKDFEGLGPYNAVDPPWSLERMIETIVRKRAVLEA